MSDYLDDRRALLAHIRVMKNAVVMKRIAIGLSVTTVLCACQTVSVPKLDFVKTPEFNDEAANIDKSYPSVSDAPAAPTDVRSAAQGDNDVRELQALRDAAGPADAASSLTQSDDEARFEALKAKVQAYKKDDPVSGPAQGFPDYRPAYKPRR